MTPPDEGESAARSGRSADRQMRRVGNGGRRFSTGGFTLLELLVVLLVLTLIAGATMPALLGERAPDDDLTAAVRKVETLFRLARDSAISSRVPVTVVIDSATALVWLLTEPSSSPSDAGIEEPGASMISSGIDRDVNSAREPLAGFESGTSLELPASVDLQLGVMRARFTFLPTGTAMADSLVLRSGATRLTLTLDPWTGDVLAH